jgi:hypothetical protein
MTGKDFHARQSYGQALPVFWCRFLVEWLEYINEEVKGWQEIVLRVFSL